AVELEQMRAGAEHRTGMTYDSNEDYLRYLAGTSALNPDGGAEQALWTAYNDYNGGTYQQNDPRTGDQIPGSQVPPGRCRLPAPGQAGAGLLHARARPGPGERHGL